MTGGRRRRSLHTTTTQHKSHTTAIPTNVLLSLLPLGAASLSTGLVKIGSRRPITGLLENGGHRGGGFSANTHANSFHETSRQHNIYLPEAPARPLSFFSAYFPCVRALLHQQMCGWPRQSGRGQRSPNRTHPVLRVKQESTPHHGTCIQGLFVLLPRKVDSKLLCSLLCISCSAF